MSSCTTRRIKSIVVAALTAFSFGTAALGLGAATLPVAAAAAPAAAGSGPADINWGGGTPIT